MEFSRTQIAGLVLGYLRNEKLFETVDAFLRTSPYLDEKEFPNIRTRFSVTRVHGRTLVDYLKEYAAIYTIVQAYLERSNYYSEVTCHTSLLQQVVYLLYKEQPAVATSTPVFRDFSEVDATPAHDLPGNSSTHEDNSGSKTPKRRTRSKSKEKDDMMDVSEALTRSLLEKHELHEKIAETINNVRSAPEVGEENVSSGASKELEALIKTVVQRTEEDPIYNKIIDEIIGTAAPLEAEQPTKNPVQTNDQSLAPEPKLQEEQEKTVNDHNDDAIRSIIEVSQNPPPPPPPPPSEIPKTNESGVYLFDGTLDTYLKTAAPSNSLPANPLYINTGGLIVMPPEPPKQFYIVNNQPLVSVSTVKSVITDTDIMAMPTIIVSDDNNQFAVAGNKKKTKTIVPKPARNDNLSEFLTLKPEGKDAKTKSKSTQDELINEVQPEPSIAQHPSVSTSRPASHVRNLDFSTPMKSEEKKPQASSKKAWDADLRTLTTDCKDKSPQPKRKKTVPKKKKEEEEVKTPDKEVPKTPGAGGMTTEADNNFCNTPFTDVLEEQLKGVDLISLPTPKIPITPGFSLTPGDPTPYNNRPTDYSNSSSYYQPSDTEQSKSLDQLIEECKKLEDKRPPSPKSKDKFSSLKILSDVVIEQGKIPVQDKNNEEAKKVAIVKNDIKTTFNHNVIGKKNLSLVKRLPTTSSSSEESDEEFKPSEDNPVICKKPEKSISDIISEVKVNATLDEEAKKQSILSHLEQVRQRTVSKIKNPPEPKKKNKRNVKAPLPKPAKTVRKRNTKKSEDNTDEEAQKLVKGLAQRGIHLIPNKTPKKEKEDKPKKKKKQEKTMEKPTKTIVEKPTETITEEPIFTKKVYDDFETMVHEEGEQKKEMRNYDLKILDKTFEATVLDEETNGNVTRIITCRSFEWLVNETKTADQIEDELMDYSLVGSVREESPEKQPPKGGKKRKTKSEDEKKQPEKKSKTYQNNIKLLKKIDVDVFLDQVHNK